MRCRRTVLLIAWLMMALVGTAQSEDFYETRLRAGQEAYRQKLAVEAVDQLRIAAFGFLDRPSLLSESLARLALAQAAASRSADVDATLSRFLGVERQFAPYAQIKLEPDAKTEFQSLLLQRVPQTTLLSLAGLAGLVETEEQKIVKLPSRERRRALEALFRREPGNAAWPLGLAREAAERQAHKDVERWAGQALRVDAGNSEALALRAHARAARRECAEALSDLKALPQAELGARPELHADRFVCLVERKDWAGAEGTFKLIPAKLMLRSDVARAERELAAERARRNKENAGSAGAAAKSSERIGADRPERIAAAWKRGTEQLPLVSPFTDAEAIPMFYAAVVLFETGRAEEARDYMTRALLRVSGPFVDEYARKILGGL